MKTAQEAMRDVVRHNDEQACRAAYDNRYHKIRAAVGYDEFRAIWFKALESHAVYEAELQRLAEIGKPLADRGITLPILDDGSDHMILSVRKGTMTEGAATALQNVVRLVSDQTPFVVAAGDHGARLINIAKLVDEKFSSGNDIPVTRITITRNEVDGLL